MASITQRAINGEFAGSWRQNFEHLRHHNRPMRTGRRLAARDYLGDVGGVALGRVLFIFLGKVSRITSLVTRPPLGSFGSHCGGGLVKARSFCPRTNLV